MTVAGTLGGVLVTQAANSWITWGARRKERHDRINDAVSDMIAVGGAWVFAINGCEQRAVDAIIQRRSLPLEELLALVAVERDAVVNVQIDFSRAHARVRLTCPVPINKAATRYLKALQAHNDDVLVKIGELAEACDLRAIQRSAAVGVVDPLDELVKVTCEETGGSAGRLGSRWAARRGRARKQRVHGESTISDSGPENSD